MPRYTIDFGEEFDLFLSDMAKEERTTKSEMIRRSIAYYGFIRNEVIKDPKLKVSITNHRDEVLKDIVVPFWQITEKNRENRNSKKLEHSQNKE